jgi:hypothetical protein
MNIQFGRLCIFSLRFDWLNQASWTLVCASWHLNTLNMCFMNSSHQSVCLRVCPHIAVSLRICQNVTAAKNAWNRVISVPRAASEGSCCLFISVMQGTWICMYVSMYVCHLSRSLEQWHDERKLKLTNIKTFFDIMNTRCYKSIIGTAKVRKLCQYIYLPLSVASCCVFI